MDYLHIYDIAIVNPVSKKYKSLLEHSKKRLFFDLIFTALIEQRLVSFWHVKRNQTSIILGEKLFKKLYSIPILDLL